jgi:RsiW-degrading membrane proteinase PrsW (M82 family)
LLLPGALLSFGLLCSTLILVFEGDSQAVSVGLGSVTLSVLTIGAGTIVFWHGLRSLQGKPSQPLRFQPAWLMAGIFCLLVTMGLFISNYNFAPGLLFPPILLVAAALPPLLAVSWFAQSRANGVTRRRGWVAFAGGATVSVFIALLLEFLFPLIFLALVFNLFSIASDNLEKLIKALAGRDIATALTSPGFIYAFVQLALIAPLAEELAKPLITLPVIGRLSQRDAFLIGAMAGAGFAALENLLYAGFGYGFWAGILVVRALGGAIHPLGAGLVALGWRDVWCNEPNAWRNWFARFGTAVGIHTIWNGGSLLVITLAGAQFFGELPPEIDVLGLSAAGTTLALLIILGLIALWLGRVTISDSSANESWQTNFSVSDRAMAIWALACLAAIVPAGIAGLQFLIK